MERISERDYFAGLAMAALLGSAGGQEAAARAAMTDLNGENDPDMVMYRIIAGMAYDQADAMMKARRVMPKKDGHVV